MPSLEPTLPTVLALHVAAKRGSCGATEQVLKGAFDGSLEGEAFERALTPMVAGGFHFAGAVMFGVIDRSGGLPAVMDVLRDPRRLLVAYNEAMSKLGSGSTPTVDPDLAKRLAAAGR